MRRLPLDYRRMTAGLRAAVLVAATAGALHAQVVRGVVRDVATRMPLPGVVVSLEEVGAAADSQATQRRASLALAVLTNERGEYAVRATNPGRYVLSGKRVGLKRYDSPPFQLNAGESRRQDFELDHIDFTATLPQVSVTTDAPCSVNPAENQRVATLWEEARAALTATRLSLRDRLFQATMVRYVRELRPSSLRILKEDQVTRRGVTEQPFTSLAAESLSADGWVQPGDGGTYVYFGPDAAVLMSREFVRDHCFSLARRTREHAGHLGLAFEPVRGRSLPDIRGALWMDSSTYELRSVDFRFVNVPDGARSAESHGEVHFHRLPNGAWHVSKWFIRTPAFRLAMTQPGVPGAGLGPVMTHYREEGGDVTPEGQRGARGAVLLGRALDSTGRAPLRGATVRLTGTRYTGTVMPDGTFRLDSLPGGAYTLALEHPSYDALGLLASEQDLEIADQGSSTTLLQALATDQVLRRLCGTDTLDHQHAVARVLVQEAGGTPLAGARVEAHFQTFEVTGSENRPLGQRAHLHEGLSDERGAVNFCELPALQTIRFVMRARAGEPALRQHEMKLERKSITVIPLRR